MGPLDIDRIFEIKREKNVLKLTCEMIDSRSNKLLLFIKETRTKTFQRLSIVLLYNDQILTFDTFVLTSIIITRPDTVCTKNIKKIKLFRTKK